jgi:hypothetical protein
MPLPVIKIKVEAHVDDLYTLSLLFPHGVLSDLHVVTSISGTKEGSLDRVTDARDRETYVTGVGCLALLETTSADESGWVAREILAPLNGYAVLAESNFKPVVPVSATIEGDGQWRGIVFGSAKKVDRPTRAITANRHALLAQLLPSRVDYMTGNPLAAYAAEVVAGPPSWADYYRVLEDIAGHRETSLDNLDEAGLAKREALNAFKKAANNRAFGRHGSSKRRSDISQESLMNLLEAREFVRNVVSAWLDLECGDRLPRDRVDGGPLRFGLDERDD